MIAKRTKRLEIEKQMECTKCEGNIYFNLYLHTIEIIETFFTNPKKLGIPLEFVVRSRYCEI